LINSVAGIIRNHYVGRTFIAPRQQERELKVRCKFNTVRRVIENRIVVLVDDSIVRGTTSKQLIKYVLLAAWCDPIPSSVAISILWWGLA